MIYIGITVYGGKTNHSILLAYNEYSSIKGISKEDSNAIFCWTDLSQNYQ